VLRALLAARSLPTSGYTEKSEMAAALFAAGLDADALAAAADESAGLATARPQPALAAERAPCPPAAGAGRRAAAGAAAAECAVERVLAAGSDLMATLGVARGASAEAVRQAYRSLCIAVHPDKTDHPQAAAAFEAVRAAYAAILDGADAAGTHGATASGAGAGAGARWRAGWQPGAQLARATAVEASAAAELELSFGCATSGCRGGPPPLGEGLLLRLPAAELRPCLVSECPHCRRDVTFNAPPPPPADSEGAARGGGRGAAKRARELAGAGGRRATASRFELPTDGCERAPAELGLPDGWWVHAVRCDRGVKDGGKVCRYDKYYLCPAQGLRFRSLLEVSRHLATQQGAECKCNI
jgi:hypothetical protein